MSRNSILSAVVLCFGLGISLPLLALDKQYTYQPHYLSNVEDASNQLQFFSPHFSPMEVSKKGRSVGVTRGYSLERIDVNRLGINLSFTKSGVTQKSQYFWSWSGGYSAPVSTPFKDDIVTSIVYADVKFFEIWNFAHTKGAASWCVVPNGYVPGQNNMICVAAEKDAQGVIDAVATLVAASGGNVESSPGMWVKATRSKGGETCKVSYVESNGPPAQAGIQVGDILHTINGKHCEGGSFTAIFSEAVREKSKGGVVQVEIFRKGQPLALDLRYPDEDAAVALLRQKASGSASNDAALANRTPVSPHAAQPSSGVRFGFQVRAVTDADVSPMNLPKPKGIVVVNVDKGGTAEGMGIQSGDVIVEVNNSEVGDMQLFAQSIRSGAVKSFRILRKGQSVEIVVPESL